MYATYVTTSYHNNGVEIRRLADIEWTLDDARHDLPGAAGPSLLIKEEKESLEVVNFAGLAGQPKNVGRSAEAEKSWPASQSGKLLKET